jgi:transposase
MSTLFKKRKEFTKLYLTGNYTQRQIAAQIGISEKTACVWVREIPELDLYKSKRALLKELKRLTDEKECSRNNELINSVITHIERLQRLINKSSINGNAKI